jgi:formylglycine-generating enzyme required for sulfatase activity
MDGSVVIRDGLSLTIDLARIDSGHRELLWELAARQEPTDELSLAEFEEYFGEEYYELTEPYPDLEALLDEHPYRDNPDWLHIPVDSATFHRRRVLHIDKDRIADALVNYFDNDNVLIFPMRTLIVAESFDKEGNFLEAEVLRKREDTFWNFAVYDKDGVLATSAVRSGEEGNLLPETEGLPVPQSCAACHRIDRLDFSGDPEAPVRAPIRGFFHRLPARVPQIHLGSEYYDHMAFTELTEASARVKDGVFGVYGSLLLSELRGRGRLEALSDNDRARYQRLESHYPELLKPLDRTESFVNSLKMMFMRVPAAPAGAIVGSLGDDPDHHPDEKRHSVAVTADFFLQSTPVTNEQFAMFRPGHRSGGYRGVNLGGANQPVVNVDLADALAFIDWLNKLPGEAGSVRTYRLPTEQEWEYAARGGDDRLFPWGDAWPPPEGVGNLGDAASGRHFQWEALRDYKDPYIGTAPVRRFHASPFFLYDLAGNVYEWTSSEYGRYPGGGEGKQQYDAGFMVVRGSSWADELRKVFRCAFRQPRPADTKIPFLGFRVAAELREPLEETKESSRP